MAIEITCTGCRRALHLPDAAAGKKGKCPHCLTMLQVPAVEEQPIVEAALAPEPPNEPQPSTRAIPSRPAEAQMKRCPFCAEDIRAEAVKCKHCGSMLDGSGNRPPLRPEAIISSDPQIVTQVKCQACGHEVSKDAKKCSHCGRQVKKGVSKAAGCGLVFVSLVCLGGLFSMLSEKGGKSENASPTTLNASVSFNGAQFVIMNKDSFNWSDVKLEINSKTFSSGFITTVPLIEGGGAYCVGAMRFANSDGEMFDPFKYKAMNITISCQTPQGPGFYCGSWN